MANSLSPFVYWGQSNDNVSLKVDLRDVEDVNVNLTEESLDFSAQGLGIKGAHQYSFHLDFYLPVDPERSRYRKTDIAVEFQLQKAGSETWPRLTSERLKLPWLKIDFDKFPLDDSDKEHDSDMENGQNSQREMLDKITAEITSNPSKDALSATKAYLFFYNLFQFVGYTFIFGKLLYIYILYGQDGMEGAFEAVGSQMVLCQAVAVMEAVHPLFGLVKSNVTNSLLQVLGRNLILFVLVLQEPRLQLSSVCWLLFIIWSSVEVIRYPFYLLQLMNIQVKFLTWLRYNVWIPLYPLGILIEGAIVFKSISYFTETGFYSVSLPNSANVSFYFPYFLIVHLLLIALGGTNNLKHMYAQRKKQLSGSKKTLKEKIS
ncbi:very-long-chain (3r)-3-hydroxyacyl-coa dehydratase [Plakobranchus ocellatus]|uniref:Very-long-chain (3R)-3-hydroxyacyl-CoA dehydratase n=1 Tax=Plakobranchus ocellatus TaxID=259542 RepID=A0AAV4DAK6_9GAST|nr:very-long-chain (3r)-3-hydroxyacyl-coa dehydratase [Plakobranchus ocellatus]